MGFILGGIGSIWLIAMYMYVFRDIGIDVLFNLNAFLIDMGATITAVFIGFPVNSVTFPTALMTSWIHSGIEALKKK